MYISEETAQLILDAIAWINDIWNDSCDFPMSDEEILTYSRENFVDFCKARGIEGVEKVVKIDDYRQCDH